MKQKKCVFKESEVELSEMVTLGLVTDDISSHAIEYLKKNPDLFETLKIHEAVDHAIQIVKITNTHI